MVQTKWRLFLEWEPDIITENQDTNLKALIWLKIYDLIDLFKQICCIIIYDYNKLFIYK